MDIIEKLNRVAQGLPTKRISELDKSRSFLVTRIKKVNTRFGVSVIVELDDECQSFLPTRVSAAMINDEELYKHLVDGVENKALYIYFVNNNLQFKNK